MKKSLLLVTLFALTFTFQADAQMKIKKFGISLGQDWDMLPGLSTETLLAKTDGRLANDLSPFFDIDNSHQYSSACDNPNLRLSLVFEPQRWSNVELHTSGVFIFNRMDAVYLYDNDGSGYRHLDIVSHGNEIDVEGVLLKKVPFSMERVPMLDFLNWKTINLYGGLGANAGYQFGNYLSVWGSQGEYEPGRWGNFRDSENFYEDDNINDGISTRVFAQAGFGIELRKIELGFEGRYGAGLRHYFATDTDFTNLHSVAVNLKFLLGNRLSKAERALRRAEKAKKRGCRTWEEYIRCEGR